MYEHGILPLLYHQLSLQCVVEPFFKNLIIGTMVTFPLGNVILDQI